MINKINELRALLAIDIFKLDVECQKQPQYITDIEDIVADLKCESRKREMEYDTICSEAEFQIRENPSTFGISKITESAVKAAIVKHGDVRNAMEKIIAAKHIMEKATAVSTGFHHKRAMLDNEIKGAISGLFGDVSNNSNPEFTRRGRNSDG